jgi:hypothetical protein
MNAVVQVLVDCLLLLLNLYVLLTFDYRFVFLCFALLIVVWMKKCLALVGE